MQIFVMYARLQRMVIILNTNKKTFIEKVGEKIPDPVIIFMLLYVIVLVISFFLRNHTFYSEGTNGIIGINNMFTKENIQWIFNNAILNNWLAYAGGILGTILVVMFGIGIAEESGLLSALIRRVGANANERIMPYILVFLGIMSNITTDAGYIILIPLAGILYLSINKNPIIGMAAAFAGVSAGFSANLIPATVVDTIIGTNAQGFANSQNVPFVSYLGKNLNPMTMHYYFMVASTFLLVFLGGFITNKITKPRLSNKEFFIPEEINLKEFEVGEKEKRGLKFALLGFLLSLIIIILLAFFPLKTYIDVNGKSVNPFLNNIVLFITFAFFLPGVFYGYSIGSFKNSNDVVRAMSKQIGSMGYAIVLTFFCYNFLALLEYTNIGTYITYLGANVLKSMGLSSSAYLMIIAFIIITAIINLFVGGLTAKWMLLGPIFIPMLYRVNPSLTPDVVAAAYRVADSSTNIITPLMTYSGVVLMYMRRYQKNFSIGSLISTMLPYSLIFTVSWIILLLLFISFKIPLGF